MNDAEYLDALLTLPSLYNPLMTRDGKWVAWMWLGIHPTIEVYAAPTDGSQPPIRLTESPENTYLIGWTPDGRSVLVKEDRDGNERMRLYRVDLERPGMMIPLTAPDPNHYTYGGELHPDGRHLFYSANVDPDSGAEIEPMLIFRHDLETGTRQALARPEKAGWTYPQLSPDGAWVLYGRVDRHPAGRQMWLVSSDGQGDREVFNEGEDRKVGAEWFPDSRRVLVMAETPTHTRLDVWDRETEARRTLLDDPARNIEYAFVPYGSEQIVVVEVRDAVTRCSLLDPESGEETAPPDVPGDLTLLAPVCDGSGDWVALYRSSRQPADLVRFSPADPRPDAFRSLTRIWERTPLTPTDLTPAENFRWRSVDGLEIHGWLYRTRSVPARGTVVYVHGGPTGHSADAINAEIQYFARQGFNVLDPNYRGSTGYSMTFRESIKQDGWGGREQEDIRAGIEALIAAGIAERGKVGITGTSYGGYSSWHAITHFPPETLAASAPVCGMTDLVVDYETTRPDLRPYSEEMLGGSPSQVPQKYYDASPINFVGNIKGHLLIVQGMTDPNVTPENVRAVTGKLQEHGVEYGLLAFEDEGHGILKQKNRKVLYMRLAEFFGQAFGQSFA